MGKGCSVSVRCVVHCTLPGVLPTVHWTPYQYSVVPGESDSVFRPQLYSSLLYLGYQHSGAGGNPVRDVIC